MFASNRRFSGTGYPIPMMSVKFKMRDPGCHGNKIWDKIDYNLVCILACLYISGAVRTTPTAALAIVVGTASLPVHVMQEAMAACNRLKPGAQWVSTNCGHTLICSHLPHLIPISRMRGEGDNLIRSTLVAMVTKIWKFPHKITITQLIFKIGPRILHQTWGLGVGRSHGVIQIFTRPTLVAMVTKIGKFCQKIGYNSACVWDIVNFLSPNRGVLGSSDLTW